MIPYSLHVAIILAIWFVFYKLFLHKETYYRLNRIMLLLCLVLAFALPLIPVPEQFSLRKSEPLPVAFDLPQQVEQTPVTNVAPVPLPEVKTAITTPETAPTIPLTERLLTWTLWAYWCGVIILAANLLLQVVVLMYQTYKKPFIKDGIFKIVELDNDKAPCSFGNIIFINPSKYDWETYNQIILHEKIHIQQGHSFDLLLAELVLVFQWFNPFAWLYRKELESNLEFLTDDSLLQNNAVAMETYQLSLLKVAVPNWSMNITTNYNQSLLKKRIVMMNAKKSNVHIMWKYFIVLPLLVVMLAALNKPVALAKAMNEPNLMTNFTAKANLNQGKGLWFAVIKGDKINIEFKSDDDDDNRRWSSSSTFNLSDFPNLPRTEKGTFSVKREAGTVEFNGKFDEDQGFGKYKFTPNKDFKSFIEFKGIENMEDDEYFSFFMMDVKKQYVQFLNDNGFKNLTKNQIISMSAFKIDADYINFWKKIGYTDITPNNLVSLKSLKIDSVYVNDIRKAGYTDLTLQQLISFKVQRIDGKYINSIRKAKLKPSNGNDPANEEKPSPNEIVRSKVMKIDTNYIASVRDAGYQDLSSNTLVSLKSQNVSPEYIKSLQDIGLKNLPLSTLISLKSQGITAEYIKGFQDIGLKELPTSTLYSLKSQNITPAFIKTFQDIGLKDLPFSTLYTLKKQGITAEYIKSFQDIGLKDVPISTLYSLKTQNITPAFIKSYQDAGLKDVSFTTLYTFKTQGITPEYIKSFKDIGYKDISYNQYYTLKSQGITAKYLKDFQKLGFDNIPINQVTGLKANGITPEFVADMKQKGLEAKDLNKYIQLKSFSATGTTTLKGKN